ncbi:MAG: SUMF1/EgtB/PvdO family nonheme iron enzyme [Ignavibacteriales bacterium]|nr:MAG: SUMF1/EgtB/PvdO family nonheme iron enzyme [Ignavibacteriaceae bacterium]MBW7873669.1 SUMF1/EgtB/PvdO family nonheme iron enzyme [Ignavibacteria bacterium]MCZ2143894.1 SUMF1/EgtB/PvdO family nonheme iron enzyme [Ignavibacteriales bacterium]OQY70840.1 MAG: hypothetical protein B6D45_10805 [Ignavibacteriales bacterium UTCHB3]MBW7874327.1 SUMF1/EgtB/PvdO family nonheme iron enzyme [Ignavibacteria bacterium]
MALDLSEQSNSILRYDYSFLFDKAGQLHYHELFNKIKEKKMNRQLLKIFLFLTVISVLIVPQLKELNIKPAEDGGNSMVAYDEDPVVVVINSTPSQADIFIDNVHKGKTKKSMFLYPGEYDLRLSLEGYFTISEKIRVSTDTKKNIFNYNLVENVGKLELDVSPSYPTVRIDNKRVEMDYELERLKTGIHQIEVEQDSYYPYKGTVEIKFGETTKLKISLTPKIGKLQFDISPNNAECVLSQRGSELFKWYGSMRQDSILVGSYDLFITAKGYKTYRGSVTVLENKTTVKKVELVRGYETPTMVFVKGGTFTMGCNGKYDLPCFEDEIPAHRVTLNDFYIGKYEVTQELWVSVMESNTSFEYLKLPKKEVSWYEAVEFCNKLSDREGLQRAYSGSGYNIKCNFNANGYRLPTEAEWEYAARGGNKSKNYFYSGSNNLDKVGVYFFNSGYGSVFNPVGSLKPNELGLYDMSGNVEEWCWDWYGAYTVSGRSNPKGPSSGQQRVIRGGGIHDNGGGCGVFRRSSKSPDDKYRPNGFRLVRTRL